MAAALLRPISVAATRAAISSSASVARFLHSFAAPLSPFAAPLALSAPARTTTLGHVHAPPPIATDSASFAALRARRDAFVDKSDAIAELLAGDAGMHRRSRAFFARPRKFGKSLTLDVAATMLAAGELPAGVAPWPGYEPVDVDAVFRGLAVHARLRAGDPSLRGLLRHAHFVIDLDLAGSLTGAELKGSIISELAGIAGAAFGSALDAKVRTALSPKDALTTLVHAVPRGVPVALLVDEYDAAIIQDMIKSRWAAADDGVEALRSLLVTTKSRVTGARIQRCLVTGVARFARTSLFSGANNFTDMTDSPLLSRVLGFSEAEIRGTFPAELARLASGLGTGVDGAVSELARWYNGYCYDGTTSAFNPYAVLKALEAGAITERELDAASGTNWLGLAPGSVVTGLAGELLKAGVPAVKTSVDIASIEARRVHVVPLLLQTGLLSLVPGQPRLCRPPNEYARRSLQLMAETALDAAPAALAGFADALRDRDRAVFEKATRLLFEQLPRTLFKRAVKGERAMLREAVYHAALFGALTACAPLGVDVQPQASTHRGVADIVIRFAGAAGAGGSAGAGTSPPAAMWVLEVGMGGAGDAAAKLLQPQTYALAAVAGADVHCCAILVAGVPPAASAAAAAAAAGSAADGGGELVFFAWSRRAAAGHFERVSGGLAEPKTQTEATRGGQ